MGWTSYPATFHKGNGIVDRKAECDYVINTESRYAVVKSAMVGSVYYAAVKTVDSDEVWAAVFLTSVDGNEFFYKDMEETVLPYEHKCPMSILNLLTPTDNQCANTWRKNCIEYHKKVNSPKAFKNLKEGQKVLWSAPNGKLRGFHKGNKVVMTKTKVNGCKRCVWLLDNMHQYILPKYIDQDDYELIY